jgi:hypothetical protein
MSWRRGRWTALAVGLASLAAVPSALAHPERPVSFPPGDGEFPKIRTSGGPKLVVCKADTDERIRRLPPKVRAENERLLERCEYRHIQEAVNDAPNGARVMIMPGVYREQPSRKFPNPDPACEDLLVPWEGGNLTDTSPGSTRMVASYEYQLKCPNAQQLIAILGDSDDPDTRCDVKCDLQIEGTGATRRDVKIIGDQTKENVFKADRADGIVFTNFTVQYSDYNNIYVLETDGFRFQDIRSRWSNEYGFLSFVSDHGIYKDLNAYGAGDAGVYPGSGPPTEGKRFGIKIIDVNAHDNLQGNSGSAASGTLYRNNRFHDNGVGIVVDSFSSGHPGTPEDNVVWRNNDIYSNNQDYFSPELDDYCVAPYPERDPKIVCPAIMVPVGTGLLIAGGNDNLIEGNRIWDHNRYGAMLFFVEASFRGDEEPEKQFDTSHGNRFVGNVMGVAPGGEAAPNGTDFWWDEGGDRNCWSDNTAHQGAAITSNPGTLPACPGGENPLPTNPAKHAFLVPCATWDPEDNPDPVGCDWMNLPPKPGG